MLLWFIRGTFVAITIGMATYTFVHFTQQHRLPVDLGRFLTIVVIGLCSVGIDLMIRKKRPLTLKHFEEFFRLLQDRSDSELSWTVDMDERRRTAADEARPFKEQSISKSEQAA